MFIDPLGLDSYLYYDPDAHANTEEYISVWQQNLANQFYNGDISKVHMYSITSEQEFRDSWDIMSSDTSIDAIAMHGHATYQSMKFGSDFRIAASDSRVTDITSKLGGSALNINILTPITTDYFVIISCNLGRSDMDYNSSNKGSANFATDIILGKHTINNSVIASHGNSSQNSSGQIFSKDNQFRSFSWNGSGVSSFYLGNQFSNMSSLIREQILRSKNSHLYQNASIVSPSQLKKKSDK